jgi:hypothetical protein
MHMIRALDSISSFPKVLTGMFATATGAVAGHTPAVSDVHGLQLGVWIVTILAGLTTIGIGIIRLWIDLRRRD